MAKDDSTENGGDEKRESFEQVWDQMIEAMNKGFSEAVGVLQEVSSAIEKRLEEVFGAKTSAKTSAKTTTKKDLSLIHISEPTRPY